MVKVKICGITNLEDALCAQESGADFLGFVFAKSPRMIQPKDAKLIIDSLRESVKIVAVFVNEEQERTRRIISELGRVDLVQFHGSETMQYCRQFKEKKIIKAFRIQDEFSVSQIKDFDEVDFILLDSYSDNVHGGTGKGFDLCLAVKAKAYNIPLFLSGGLTPDNVKCAVDKVRPFCADVSSGVELRPGEKNHKLVKSFIQNVKNHKSADYDS
jgi:phosphoribosylanthranilate isomerase